MSQSCNPARAVSTTNRPMDSMVPSTVQTVSWSVLPTELKYASVRAIVEVDIEVKELRWRKYTYHGCVKSSCGKTITEYYFRGFDTRNLVVVDPTMCEEVVRILQIHCQRYDEIRKAIDSIMDDLVKAAINRDSEEFELATERMRSHVTTDVAIKDTRFPDLLMLLWREWREVIAEIKWLDDLRGEVERSAEMSISLRTQIFNSHQPDADDFATRMGGIEDDSLPQLEN